MFDHVTIRVPDRAAAEQFFETVLGPLGIDTSYRTKAFTEWQDFMVAEASAKHPATRGLHVAFVAPSREQVDAFWQAGTDAGYADDGAPGPRPQYLKDYYGAFLRDPSGYNSIEAVHYEAHRHREQVIDHLWIRVADLDAATSFYELVGAAAGFALRERVEDRSTFSGDAARGASFSLVSGPPTANLHVAFGGDDDAVRRFYDGAVAAGHRGNGEPGERPHYHPGYYAAYVLDPDGNNIEVVNHNRA
ncbi:MAG TPA: VOC family protein [Solirubrobacteraceae bacterium]|jgi:catechol 2,3-dioxygenase-like lactoylglutathione lyase family enzyme